MEPSALLCTQGMRLMQVTPLQVHTTSQQIAWSCLHLSVTPAADSNSMWQDGCGLCVLCYPMAYFLVHSRAVSSYRCLSVL